MKKIISILVVAVMVVSLLCVGTSALTFNGDDFCSLEVNVKKADPANVVKDGIIGEGEYERFNVDLGEDSTNLNVNYANATCWEDAVKLLGTMEYYFSWDDVHGFNFAVKCTPVPELFRQDGVQPDTDPPEDHFLGQFGFQICFDPIPTRSAAGWCPLLYYCVAKNTTTGEYLKGYYENQLGNSGTYNPVAGTDFVINYPGDGTAILEWSVPFSEFSQNASAGDEIYFSIGTANGKADHQLSAHDEALSESIISIGLGDYSYGTKCTWDYSTHCTGVLSSETISGNNQGGGSGETGGQGAGTQVVTEIETVLTTDEEGNTVVETRIVPKNVPASDSNKTNTGKRTGDPMIIIAAISAVSACGVVVFKKKH